MHLYFIQLDWWITCTSSLKTNLHNYTYLSIYLGCSSSFNYYWGVRIAVVLLTNQEIIFMIYRVFWLDGLLVHGHYFGLFSSVLYLELHIQSMWVVYIITWMDLVLLNGIYSVKENIYMAVALVFNPKADKLPPYISWKKCLDWMIFLSKLYILKEADNDYGGEEVVDKKTLSPRFAIISDRENNSDCWLGFLVRVYYMKQLCNFCCLKFQ